MMATEKTRAAILRATEILYAAQSFADVQLRDIAAEAGVAVAAINYHFGSKDELISQLFLKRTAAMNRERLDLLEAAQKKASGGKVSVEEVLRALVGPPLRWSFGADIQQSAGSRFVVRALAESVPAIRNITANQLNHIDAFALALRKAVPKLKDQDLYWGLHFTVAMVRQTINDHDELQQMSNGVCQLTDLEDVIARIVELSVPAFSRRTSKSRSSQKAGRRKK